MLDEASHCAGKCDNRFLAFFQPGDGSLGYGLRFNVIESSALEALSREAVDIARYDWNSREISWDFKKNSLIQGRKLSEAFEMWLSATSKLLSDLHRVETEIDQIIAKLYGLDISGNSLGSCEPSILQEEIDWESFLEDRSKEIPIKRQVVVQQFVNFLIGILMGRYRIDKVGLSVAHPDPTSEELISYQYNGHQVNIDEDAIIPLFGEESPFADNVIRRFKDVLVAVWGEDTLTENINFLNECLGMSYEKFLIEKFWDYHKKLYQKKPIYWLFSSAGGNFKVLVYMHRMDKFTVQKIRLNYLHKYIEYLTNQLEKLKANGATNRTADKLEKALQDCREYDKILKPLADQQISFDLDDGVTVNYAKFKPAVAPIK